MVCDFVAEVSEVLLHSLSASHKFRKKIKVIRLVIVHWNIHGMFNHISRLFFIGFKTKYVYGSALERRPVFNA